ncbi:MAG TPA: hypothetical protein VKC57_12045, partial [Ktedonobacterales bacterium]|nr:hypothetical protein [Ktedonobacterales bacterium]
MNLQRFDDIQAFAARAEPFLLAHEAAHCLLLGILSTLQAQKNPWGADAPYLALVEDAGKVVIAAVRTPPYELIVTLP